MMRTMKVRIRAGGIHVLDLQTRMPFKYGITTLRALPHLFMRLDLHIDCDSEWIGWKVAVRDALGHLLHSIPVPAPELH